VSLDVFNPLNANSDDVEYLDGSWLPLDAKNSVFAKDPATNPLLAGSGVNDDHFHPSEGRIVRVTYALPL
jgi:hypothetical protein